MLKWQMFLNLKMNYQQHFVVMGVFVSFFISGPAKQLSPSGPISLTGIEKVLTSAIGFGCVCEDK